ncbi:hypothetical protein [Runella salmonicolor]|uniref:Natural product n=1 Tax=Runella salmonicolor TaxID=2950278 RepID=A0ABT1FP01_9BACT|nr:hypothetical protein [Runella salmonicolor]MCP1383500.1 hypothetical protein [Runella salmonicolor]
MKSKFKGLNFESVEVLTQEEKKKVSGGYGTTKPVVHKWYCPGQSAGPVDGGYAPTTQGYDACMQACNILNYSQSANGRQCQYV